MDPKFPLDPSFDLAAIRSRLATENGPRFWRSLEELADSAVFNEYLRHEFPRQADAMAEAPDRRQFLRLMAASLALAGVAACSSAPPEKIVPYVIPPENLVAGKPQYFATAMPHAGYGIGLIATSMMGRPIKVDGNPDHPASLGATDVFAQASVLDLYDPDRSKAVTRDGRVSTFDAFLRALSAELELAHTNQGSRIRILTETVTSPVLASQIRGVLEKFPQAEWISYEPISDDNLRAGSQLAFGAYFDTQYRFDKADVILSLDSDFLSSGPAQIRISREFSQRRSVTAGTSMNRLYVAEPAMTITGAMADHRFPTRRSDIGDVARAVAHGCGVQGVAIPGETWPWLAAVVADLKYHAGASLVIAGPGQSPDVHALLHSVNQQLNNTGTTVSHTDPVEQNPGDQRVSMQNLCEQMRSGAVDVLLILGGNPVYTAPSDCDFASGMDKVRFRMHLGLYDDETSQRCQWHLPEAHYLESWGDVRAYDGTASIIQPLINPLYGGRSGAELMSAVLGNTLQSGYDITREYWRQQTGDGGFETMWRQALQKGIVPNTTFPLRTPKLLSNFQIDNRPARSIEMETVFYPDPTVFDGRFANNGWLQELPKPLSRLTWDNAAGISPRTATTHHLSSGDVVEIESGQRKIEVPIWISPGHVENSVSLYLGYGRRHVGRVGNNLGTDVFSIRNSNSPWAARASLRKTGRRWPLASTQLHQSMEDRDNVRTATLDAYSRNSRNGSEKSLPVSKDFSLYPERAGGDYAWGMSIDLNTCVGCNACVVACQAENNIPIVGKSEVLRGREMHWLRIDTYFRGEPENPEAFFQPVPCMHCEDAPCELVCPVAATTHSSEGLNEMTYNRCVGTRYCSNNCPYKVRRFNFFQYSSYGESTLELLANPEVSVRSRGVMEKCTYCVQRINAAHIEAEKQDRPIRDGEVKTACQVACPADAIVFGDIRNPENAVARLKAEPRNYALLEELNTRPRTTYLARLTNPNPEIPTEGHHG
jgi:MoCo/4Fe-4S cofactor protein with predicted Tat translocation signal